LLQLVFGTSSPAKVLMIWPRQLAPARMKIAMNSIERILIVPLTLSDK
jgi:hypothetical protein